MGGGLVYELIVTRLCKVSSLFGCVPLVRQRPEVALFGFVSTRCIASEVLIKASFIKKKKIVIVGYFARVIWFAPEI
jgi:hypothetical protein